MNINKININQSEQTYYIASDIYDVSYHNNGATFESLSALLNDSNLSTLIPSAIRCGGMSIRFIQSTDNKYVQYRLMSATWSITIANWQSDNLTTLYSPEHSIIYEKEANGHGNENLSKTNMQVLLKAGNKYYINIKCSKPTFTGADNTALMINLANKSGAVNLMNLNKSLAGTEIDKTISYIPETDIELYIFDRIQTTDVVYLSITRENVANIETLNKLNSVENKLNSVENILNTTEKVLCEEIKLTGSMFVQGSIYKGNILSNNTKCLACEQYFETLESDNIILNNAKQSDGKYWKVRIALYDLSKKYIKDVYGFSFNEGKRIIDVSGGSFIRITISLIDSDGTDLDCIPTDVPSDLISLLFNVGSKIEAMQKSIANNENAITSLTSVVNNKQFIKKLTTMLDISFSKLFSVTSGYGDSDCYNGKIFQFINGNAYVYVHDVSTGSLLQTITMADPNTKYHNNAVSFGPSKYSDIDEFPLIYASQENTAENKCNVYRITGSVGSYSMTLVQTIKFPANAETKLYYHNCLIDSTNNLLILSGLRNSAWSAVDTNTINYIYFNLPEISDSNVTLSLSDAVDRTQDFVEMPTTQGGFVKNGLMYQTFGVNPPQTLMVFDVKRKYFISEINLTQELKNAEPEGAFCYDNKIHIVYNGGLTYRIDK